MVDSIVAWGATTMFEVYFLASFAVVFPMQKATEFSNEFS